jgi:hypothetical protein
VRELITWTGSIADFLRISAEQTSQTGNSTGFPKNPRALAGHLRRALFGCTASTLPSLEKAEPEAG